MALIGFNLPTSITTTISGTGATIDTDVAKLYDGAPASVVRYTWASGTQSTSTTVKTQHAFASAKPLRLACLLGCTLPVGTKVQIKGKRAGDGGYTYDLGGNSLSQRLVQFANGSIGCWWVFDRAVEALVGVEVTRYNDVNGAAAIAAEASFDEGEFAPLEGREVAIVDNLDDGMDNPGRPRRAPSNQSTYFARNPIGKFDADLVPMSEADYLEMRRLRYLLATQPVAAFLPRVYVSGTSTIDAATMNQLAMYGGTFVAMTLKRVKDSSLYDGKLSLQEYPPR